MNIDKIRLIKYKQKFGAMKKGERGRTNAKDED